MRLRVIPTRRLIIAVVAGAAALLVVRLAGLGVSVGWPAALALLVVVAGAAAFDYFRSRAEWRRSAVTMRRVLPPAFAIGVRRPVRLVVDVLGVRSWPCEIFDHADPSLILEGLPAAVTLAGGSCTDATYLVTPSMRGDVVFVPADVRVRSIWGFCDLLESIGPTDGRRVYPDFAQVARYAWLAGDRRLQEIGIKTYQQRGEGTDFKQLAEYRIGDSIRHIDWRATQRVGKPIVREFQNERDQCVLLLLDCGRRMRADDRQARIGTSHFDQVLNAVMLLAYVALDRGDAVGVTTFGTDPAQARSVAPRHEQRTA
jgi:uncharacterized protein (DUF58 family)